MHTQLTPVGLLSAVGIGIFLSAAAYTYDASYLVFAFGCAALVYLDGTASHAGSFQRARRKHGFDFWWRKRPDDAQGS